MTLLRLLRSISRNSAEHVRPSDSRVAVAGLALAFTALVLPVSLAAQQSEGAGDSEPAIAVSAAPTDVLPPQALGADDLLQIMVPYCPELSRSFRISSDGTLTLPLLKKRLKVAGLQPSQVEQKISAELVSEQILTDPVVNVAVLEYRSKPISVVGAVAHPLTFQASGSTNLLDAIARAGGLTAAAGREITVTHREQTPRGGMHITVQSIPVKGLLDQADPKLNVRLVGDEEVRVPEAGRIFVAGNVRKPGSFIMQDNSDTTVVKALAMSEGLESYSSKDAYIYRETAPGTPREQITVPLSKILARKAPDVVLQPDDILYVPENNGRRMTAKVLAQLAGFGASTAAGVLIYH